MCLLLFAMQGPLPEVPVPPAHEFPRKCQSRAPFLDPPVCSCSVLCRILFEYLHPLVRGGCVRVCHPHGKGNAQCLCLACLTESGPWSPPSAWHCDRWLKAPHWYCARPQIDAIGSSEPLRQIGFHFTDKRYQSQTS